MATFYDEIDEKLKAFIERQKIFFVATADSTGRVNLSPKGYEALKILGPNRLVWLNLTGSGNETAAQLKALNRMTIMMCSFEVPPLILRLYGTAKTIHSRDEAWEELIKHFPDMPGSRQLFDMQVETAQTSCGFGVPKFDFVGERDALINYNEKKGPEGVKEYWGAKNTTSIDGLPTDILGD